MKKYKGIIAALLGFVLICSLAACAEKKNLEPVTQLVTDENGVAVTDENGEFITEELEAELLTDKDGKVVTEIVTDKKGKAVTTVKDGKYQNVTQAVTVSSKTTKAAAKKSSGKTTAKATTKKSSKSKTTAAAIKKPSKPDKVTNFKASSVEETSLNLSWSSVKCTGYQLQYSTDGVTFKTLEKAYTKTSYSLTNLTSYTDYTFKVRAYNKNDGGTTVGNWTTLQVKTKEDKTSRYITLNVTLPIDGNKEDTLIISVDGKKVAEKKVNLDGSVYTYKTDKKYKGAVKIEVSLKDKGNAEAITSDKDSVNFDISASGIYILEGEDD